MKLHGCIFGLCFASSACWVPIGMGRVATTQAPSDLECPSARVSSYPWGHHLATEPVFHGCGRIVKYHCLATLGEDDTSCAPIFIGKDQSYRAGN